MDKFLRTLLVAMICFLVIQAGCTNTKTSKKFSYTMEDGSHVTIKIEYKPNSQISGNEKCGAYYYIVQYFDTKLSPSEAGEQQGKAKDLRIEFSFYDRKGYSLASTLAPGWSHNEDEENRIDGGWEWKGRFDERYITVENFRDIHSIKVTYVSR